jgi:hypothetical protein
MIAIAAITMIIATNVPVFTANLPSRTGAAGPINGSAPEDERRRISTNHARRNAFRRAIAGPIVLFPLIPADPSPHTRRSPRQRN